VYLAAFAGEHAAEQSVDPGDHARVFGGAIARRMACRSASAARLLM
jgi:hypothetical protein